MKIRIPLFVKIMTPLIALIVLTVGLSGYRVYEESTRHVQSEIDARLERIAALTASTINIDTLQQIRTPQDITSPAYQEIVQQLEQARTAGNLAWIGIYRIEDDFLYYWVDTDSSGVGYPFFYSTPEHLAAYQDQKPHPIQYTDEYGTYYGFVAPIMAADANGQPYVLGLVEASIVEESRQLLSRETWNRILSILIGGSVVAVGLSLLIMIVEFNRPLRHLQHGAMVLASGKFGHTIDLRSRDELGELAQTFNQMSTQIERLYRERAEAERMQRELEIAHNVQRALFPTQLPQNTGWEIAAICRPHRETSGDYYDVLSLGDGQLGIIVGDVSGKSIPAAMVMVAAHGIIRSEAYDHASPATVLNEANTLLCRDVPHGMFVAASFARLDAHKREMVWANAGQIYPFLLHRVRPDAVEEYPRYLETTGTSLPLGLDPAARYEEQRLTLLPGDTLLFYTDGIVEAMNQAHKLYSFERLEALVRSLPPDLAPQALIDTVLADVAAFVGPAEQHDDITIVAVKLLDQS